MPACIVLSVVDLNLNTYFLEDFASLKSSLPYGQLPVLEYDGEVLCQSLTIARFLARESGLAGQSALESAQIDEVVDSINDTQLAIVRFYHHLLIII